MFLKSRIPTENQTVSGRVHVGGAALRFVEGRRLTSLFKANDRDTALKITLASFLRVAIASSWVKRAVTGIAYLGLRVDQP
jgi:hypothetical protein